jgi:hypothetical protein
VKLLGGPGVKDKKVGYGHDYPGYGGGNVGTGGYSGRDSGGYGIGGSWN